MVIIATLTGHSLNCCSTGLFKLIYNDRLQGQQETTSTHLLQRLFALLVCDNYYVDLCAHKIHLHSKAIAK
jgi:hypothetical protein